MVTRIGTRMYLRLRRGWCGREGHQPDPAPSPQVRAFSGPRSGDLHADTGFLLGVELERVARCNRDGGGVVTARVVLCVMAATAGVWVALYAAHGAPVYIGFAVTSSLVTLAMAVDL